MLIPFATMTAVVSLLPGTHERAMLADTDIQAVERAAHPVRECVIDVEQHRRETSLVHKV